MTKRVTCLAVCIVVAGWVATAQLAAALSDAAACLSEVKQVCVHLEDQLETCLATRGSQLSAACRDTLKSIMHMVSSASGPGVCVADVKRLCPSMESEAMESCILQKKSQFSEACQRYLNASSQGEK
jgi:hypothetical protein